MRITKKYTESLVSKNNLKGKVHMGHENGIWIIFSDGGSLDFTNSTDASKVYRFLTLELGFSKPSIGMDSQDEIDGMSQANELWFKCYEHTCLTA